VREDAQSESFLYEYVSTHASSQEAISGLPQQSYESAEKTELLRSSGGARLLREIEMTPGSGGLRKASTMVLGEIDKKYRYKLFLIIQ